MFSLKSEYPKYYSYQGRKISKKISLSQKNIINKFYDQYSFDDLIVQYHNNKNSEKKLTLPKNFQKVNVEIGFGNGEFLLKNAISNPEELFIGIEVYINGIAKVLKAILNLQIKNIILCNLNSLYFLEAMPYKSVDKIFIINPDPWIKKRHKKRRFISIKTVRLLSKIIKSKNSIFMTTDSESFLKDTEDLLSKHKEIFGDCNLNVLSKKDEFYGISKYQRKAIEKGRKIYLLVF